MDSSTISCTNCRTGNKADEAYCISCGRLLPGYLLQDRYRILEIVGQGGMGVVYKATDIELDNRPVAVKESTMPNLQTQEELDTASRLFEQEALLLAKLSHPSLPDIYAHFGHKGHWYFAMQYISGETLSKRLRNMTGKGFPVEDALQIGIKLCKVLDYLHSQTPPIIFGDLKPDNIMLTPRNDLYLIDFGIARFFATTQTVNWKIVSHDYSPPEQYENAQISPRADIYSLGATLYQLLSGRYPSKDQKNLASLQLGKQLWARELKALILSMVEPDEQQRPQGIANITQALQRIATRHAQQYSITDPTFWNVEAPVPRTLSMPSVPSGSSSEIDTPSLPASIFYREIRLALDHIDSLVWSPNGSCLAAANNKGEVHIYAWPPDERQRSQENKVLTPLRIWSLNMQQSLRMLPAMIAWAPDSNHLVVSAGTLLFILDVQSEHSSHPYRGHKNEISALAWSPDGQLVASASGSHQYDRSYKVQVWKARTRKKIQEFDLSELNTITWSPDSLYLAIAFRYHFFNSVMTQIPPAPGMKSSSFIESTTSLSDRGILICKAINGDKVFKSWDEGDWGNTYDSAWSPDGTYIVSCGDNPAVQIWDPIKALKLRSLEAHTDSVQRIAFLDNGRLLASVSTNGTTYIWNTNTWMRVESFGVHSFANRRRRLARREIVFHPTDALLAIPNLSGVISLYEINVNQLYLDSSKRDGVQYTNAKVVLVGDSGVGKSGLGLVLSHQGFTPTESSHARKVWTFAKRPNTLPDGSQETRETLLWDLAGQPGYRLIHQLHLNDIALALVVFDGLSETDPFAGISHWVRALRTAQRIRGNMGALKMLLVQARIDRGGVRVNQQRIDEFVQRFGFDGYFETSAKEGTNMLPLAEAIEETIEWEKLRKVTSTELFQRIKAFLISEKQEGRTLSKADDLYRIFLREGNPRGENKDFSAEFATGITLLESTGLIRQLNFGNLVLLQPELIDTYASALVHAARDEPDGLGNIAEEVVYAAAFPIPPDERIDDPEQEKLLLIAMVQDLLSYEIALREQGVDGQYLVFPSESTRENPDLPDPENASIVFNFEGPVRNIYATLAVRLSHTGLFKMKEPWKNAIIYDAEVSGTCGIWLKEVEEGRGELTLFFDEFTSNETRYYFEDYVRKHLQRRALHESVGFRRIFRCNCTFIADDQLVRLRTERGFNWFSCPVCESRIDMRGLKERLTSVSPSQVPKMNRAADIQRARATAQSTVQGKQETNDFDVFLCYNTADQAAIMDIGKELKEQGYLPWLDIWELQPGRSWQRLLEQQIEQIAAAVVFVGKEGIGPWQRQELDAFLREFARRECPVIPVILSDAPEKPELPLFLQGIRWVDFREQVPTLDINPMEQLIWGITGKR